MNYRDFLGQLTVGEALELNKAAELTCGYEATAVGGEG